MSSHKIDGKLLLRWLDEKYHDLEILREYLMFQGLTHKSVERRIRQEIWIGFFHDFSKEISSLCVDWFQPTRRTRNGFSRTFRVHCLTGLCRGVVLNPYTHIATFDFSRIAVSVPQMVKEYHNGVVRLNGGANHEMKWIPCEWPYESVQPLQVNISEYTFNFDQNIHRMTVTGVRCNSAPEDSFIMRIGGHRWDILNSIPSYDTYGRNSTPDH